ncbi:MAG: hypothetical protein EJNHJLOP_00023 [Methanophagales virus PBV082]|uniref:Uncharacterized protein n=1 Tax=Methanophagales virus PBV082 TaxID=3071307 RepID=A0AA46TDI1_9VIRU|nr:MAG: hypothetical protein QIT52_gp23 [Methanophagales virus PBV082]UYL64912.1 MAG: hypothetical protein EJNHJLOP_00023 [Methanophagales virus PBV082]
MTNSDNPFDRWKLISSEPNRYVFAFSRIIAGRPDMVGGVIYGMQRSGKTMYSLLVMYDFYRDWDMVLNNVFFTLEDLIDAIKNRVLVNFSKEKQLKVICWDDAGVHGSKYLFFRSRQLTEYLQNLFDVVGIAVKAILITTPNPENLLKAIRGYEFYRVRIVKLEGENRVAIGYKSMLLPSGKMIIRRVFEDYYNLRIPNDVYNEYFEKREQYLEEAISALEDILKKPEEERRNRRRRKRVKEEEV